MPKDKTHYWLITVVAMVAIVGMVVIYFSRPKAQPTYYVQDSNLAGQAYVPGRLPADPYDPYGGGEGEPSPIPLSKYTMEAVSGQLCCAVQSCWENLLTGESGCNCHQYYFCGG